MGLCNVGIRSKPRVIRNQGSGWEYKAFNNYRRKMQIKIILIAWKRKRRAHLISDAIRLKFKSFSYCNVWEREEIYF